MCLMLMVWAPFAAFTPFSPSSLPLPLPVGAALPLAIIPNDMSRCWSGQMGESMQVESEPPPENHWPWQAMDTNNVGEWLHGWSVIATHACRLTYDCTDTCEYDYWTQIVMRHFRCMRSCRYWYRTAWYYSVERTGPFPLLRCWKRR